MATPDREMLFRAMAKLMEQRDIVIPKTGLFTELMDFHRSVEDRVSIPRQLNGLTDLQRYYQNPRSWHDYLRSDPVSHLGDSTCANSANSIHLRCAVNPCGPCEGCKHYIGVDGPGGAE